MTRARILTTWISVVDATLPGGKAWMPVLSRTVATATMTVVARGAFPPSPNLTVIDLDLTPTALAAVRADPNHGPSSILHADDVPADQTPAAAEHTALRTWLRGKGLSAAQLTTVFGAGAGGRTRAQLGTLLLAFLATLPPGP